MFRSIVVSLAFLFLPVAAVWAAYPSTLKILDKKDITALTDEELTDTYMDAIVDVQARQGFLDRFGFTGKELDDYKAAIKYRLQLLLEIHSRNIDIPQFERY